MQNICWEAEATGFRQIEVWDFFGQRKQHHQIRSGEFIEVHQTSTFLVYVGNKRLLPSTGLYQSGSEQSVSLILKHSAGCIKQSALCKVMGDIYATLLSPNGMPAGVLSHLGATIGIAINPLFPILRAKLRPVFLQGVHCS